MKFSIGLLIAGIMVLSAAQTHSMYLYSMYNGTGLSLQEWAGPVNISLDDLAPEHKVLLRGLDWQMQQYLKEDEPVVKESIIVSELEDEKTENQMMLNEELLSLIQHNGTVQDVRRVLERGAHVNAYYLHGVTPLMWAIQKKRPEIVIFLILKGALVNKKDSSGKTPLDYAVDSNNLKLCRLLVRHGAELNPVRNNGEKTLLQRALLQQCDYALYMYLSKNGAKL